MQRSESLRSTMSSNSSRKNIYNIREKTKSQAYPKGFVYKPNVSEKFLEHWLDFPSERKSSWFVVLNILKLPAIWLLYTNKSMAGLDPTSTTIRERLSNQASVL